MVAFLKRMPAGIPGNVTRAEHATIEPGQITGSGGTLPPTAYGQAIIVDATSGFYRQWTSGDNGADMGGMGGVLVRPYPLSNPNTTDGLGTSTPPPTSGSLIDVLKRGYIMAKLYGTTAAVKGGTVYVRVGGAAAGKPLGGFEAAADGGNTIALDAKCSFTGPADASGNIEIGINI